MAIYPIVLACGQCTDGFIVLGAPFILYWTVAFFIWAVPFGIPLAAIAKMRGETLPLPLHPLRYLLYAGGAIVVSIPFTMGSLLLHMGVYTSVWLVRLWQSLRTNPDSAKEVKGRRGKTGVAAETANATEAIDAPPSGVAALALKGRRIAFAVCIGLVPVSYVRLLIQTMRGDFPF